MTNLMKTILTATALMFGALTATSASALSGVSGGWHCWFTVSPATCYYPHEGEPYYNLDGTRNLSSIPVENESELAMWTPRYELKAWYCMKGSMGRQMQNKDSTCIGGTPRPVYGRRSDLGESLVGETTIAMMTPEMLKAWDATLTRSTTYGSIDLDGWDSPSQLAFNRRGSTCSPNPYGRRSSYCKEGEIDAPLQSDVTASNEFGSCLLDDKPIDLESLVDCRTDRCLGRKFYYGL